MGGGADGAPARGQARVVLLGPPGAGKGTQAQVLSQRLGVPAISTGDMLREAVAEGSDLGGKVQGIMALGALVDDATMAEVVRERLGKPDARGGFLLDGYPRTLPQAETLAGILRDAGLSLSAVLLVDVPEDELVRRTVLRGRADDQEEVVRERLRQYREKTAPLIGYYGERLLLRQIDGNRPVEDVAAQMLGIFGIEGTEGIL
ncbi:MAG TPA: adenylate kinase [Thermoanaerobaculia bacterium]|nr:adenylate kinase [Thermoanaerobaculia bacterium]